MPSSRSRAGRLGLLPVILAVAGALAVSGCGSREKLSGDQASQFNSRATQFSQAMSKLNRQAAACAKKAGAGNVNAVAGCFAGIFEEISGNFEEISRYVAGLSGEVEGPCSAKLETVSTSLGKVSDQFSSAAKDFRDGDVGNLNEKLNNRRLNQIAPQLNAAEQACT